MRDYKTKRRDNGCDLHPSCLDCPLPGCIHDDEDAKERRSRLELRNIAIRVAGRSGVPTRELAAKFGLSRRAVQRVLRLPG